MTRLAQSSTSLSILLAVIAVATALMIADLNLFEHSMKRRPHVHRWVYVCLAIIGAFLSAILIVFSTFSSVVLVLVTGFSVLLLFETKHSISQRYWYPADR